ncbi:MAG TPA: MBL fold metallo-hydrolase [Xanthobacteraceae bacterium]|nr:MBL fold metallo-hydrolase [Xanthobacteraceae bacterium]
MRAQEEADGLSVRFWGVRGSAVTPGESTLQFGGNTACIELKAGPRRLIFDAGSGIAALGEAMRTEPPQPIDLLLSHLHHDHIQGLFFFPPLYVGGNDITIYCGNRGGESAEAALRRCYSPPLFPIGFDQVAARVRFVGFQAGETLDLGGLRVRTHPLRHPGGATGYRVDHGGRAVAILTDLEHDGPTPDPELVAFAAGVDLIAYDAMYDEADYPNFRGWGHSTPQMGAALARAAGADRLACIHHAPQYDDARLASMDRTLAASFKGGFLAREGAVVALPARDPVAG